MRVYGRLIVLVCAWFAVLALAHGGRADAAGEPRPTKQPEVKQIDAVGPAHPALFKVVNGKSTVYLLGSIHMLPVNFSWRTPAIEQAIAAADVFAFETNLDFSTAEFHYFIDNHGYLPRGQTLHAMLSAAALKQYSALIAEMNIDPNKLDYLRPGLAGLFLQTNYSATHGSLRLGPGVDAALVSYAKTHNKESRYLESLQSQFELMDTIGGGMEVKGFEKMLASLGKDKGGGLALFVAWTKGDLTKLVTVEDDDPRQRVLMLDNRNNAWLPEIEAMLKEPRIHLVTVGAAHLAGPKSVISLLCAKSWKVERVQTGPTPPPPGCGS
jgi:uncharacterized protein